MQEDYFTATLKRDIHNIRELIQSGVPINKKKWDNHEGWTPLHIGMDTEIAKELIEAGADINQKDKKGNTPLIEICKNSLGLSNDPELKILDYLVEAGANLNAQNNKGNTALTVACSEDKTKYVEKLIKAGADVDVKNKDGNTSLIEACKNDHLDIVKMLIKAGADVNTSNKKGETPLLYSSKNSIGTTKELLKAGADIYKNRDVIDKATYRVKKYLQKVDMAYKMLMATNNYKKIRGVNVRVPVDLVKDYIYKY